MANQPDTHELEAKWRAYWEKEGVYKFNPSSKKKIYAIDTPPPTVSGDMHMGHAFSYSQEDFIARYKRMKGFEVFYPFGTDDNGLPTERLVERLMQVKSKDMTRADFIDLCLKTLKEITPAFVQDWKNLAISCDYDLTYSTIDKHAQKISQKSFLDLFNAGRIYKADFPTIYCPECQTPVAQAELEDKHAETFFTTLRFRTQENIEIPIATTRPELLGACVAIFVNPQDKRYKKYVGGKAIVPLFEFEVPILADESAQMDKGTGVLMVCSYGDKYDVDAINRHKLKPKIIFDKQGKMLLNEYKGFSILDSRRKILKDLKEKNLIIEQKKIEHTFNVHDKCGNAIEFMPVEQWFIKILDKKDELIKQGEKIRWYPEHMFKRYKNWIDGLDWDWSISRNRHFGIPIPVWHCRKCDEIILPSEKDLPVDPLQVKKKCPKCKQETEPEDKVLDTWATSSLTPQIASDLVKGKVKIPFDLRPQGHDIIRTWAFYTITKSLLHENQIPWKDITISGFVTLGGEKMSKSKGNTVKPQESMKTYGSDALRYWAASSRLGEDIDYQEKDLVAGKKFATKMLNAANFVFMNLEHQKKAPELVETDRLLLTQLNTLVQTATEAFDEYNYAKAKLETEQFFWKIFADNYLEIVKSRVYSGTPEEKASAFYTLYQSLLTLLKLMAPITPYICEEVYQAHFKKHEKEVSIHRMEWPKPFDLAKKKEDTEVWNALLETLAQVRQEKTLAKKAMNSEVSLTLPKEKIKLLAPVLADLKSVTKARDIKEGAFSVEFF